MPSRRPSLEAAPYRALAAIPGTRVRAGDIVVIDPAAGPTQLFGLVQWLAAGPIVAALETGGLRPLCHEIPIHDVARLAGITLAPPLDATAFLKAVEGPGKPPVRERRRRKRPPRGGAA